MTTTTKEMTAEEFINNYYICKIEDEYGNEEYVAYSSYEDMIDEEQSGQDGNAIISVEEVDAIADSIDRIVIPEAGKHIAFNFIEILGEPYSHVLNEI